MNTKINKVVGVGLSKTGTSTLDLCLEFLGFGPHQGFDELLREQVRNGDISAAMEKVKLAGYVEDAPWFELYKQIDEAYPNSKFILTLRKSSDAHAVSNWHHNFRRGLRDESEKDANMAKTKNRYEYHNAAVRDYFANRPNDILEVCWENNDGWEAICPFLGVDIPLIPFPHANAKPKNAASPITKLLKRKKIYVARMRYEQFIRRHMTQSAPPGNGQ